MGNDINQKEKVEVLGLFGETFSEKATLRDAYIEPPFSILNARSGDWQRRKNRWKKLGIKSELGRNAESIHIGTSYGKEGGDNMANYTSIFDPYLCEIMYKWFCPKGGSILDPFAGGSVRGIVAGCLECSYVGIDIREEQIESNRIQVVEILAEDADLVRYICGDSRVMLDSLPDDSFDMVFSCPPYADLEVYSDLEGDISNMKYPQFLEAYRDIVWKSCDKLKRGGYAIFVVGEVRSPKDPIGGYYGFVPDTIRAFTDKGMAYYNEAILVTPVGSGSLRSEGNMKSGKIVKTHQNILCFKKR